MAIVRQTLIVGGAALLLGVGVGYLFDWGKGLPQLYGDDPKMGQVSGNVRFYKVLYLKFGSTATGEPNLTIRHASFDTSQQADNLAGAIAVLRRGSAQAGEPTPKGRIFTDFDGFKFRSPQRVYIVIDNKNVGFQNETPISFTPYGANEAVAKPDHSAAAYSRDPNYSFYNLKPVAVTVGTESLRVISFENLFRDRQGTNIPENPHGNSVEKSVYSLNINLNICKFTMPNCNLNDRNQVVPMVIDPDTGNGLGAPPPY